jgi:hypothetical protein
MGRARDIANIINSGTFITPANASATYISKESGYVYKETLYYTSTSTFSKSSYSWLRAIKVRCQGAGGGGGGTGATGGGAFVASAGGGGGGYAESFITNISGLSASVAITVGSGANGGSAGANGGSNATASSFGSLVIGDGGLGGSGGTAQTFWIVTGPGEGGGGTGDFIVKGGWGESGNPVMANGGYGGRGGTSFFGNTSRATLAWQGSATGYNGELYGLGGSGTAAPQNTVARAGGNGASGIVSIELYA